jgi:hypothetical protein
MRTIMTNLVPLLEHQVRLIRITLTLVAVLLASEGFSQTPTSDVATKLVHDRWNANIGKVVDPKARAAIQAVEVSTPARFMSEDSVGNYGIRWDFMVAAVHGIPVFISAKAYCTREEFNEAAYSAVTQANFYWSELGQKNFRPDGTVPDSETADQYMQREMKRTSHDGPDKQAAIEAIEKAIGGKLLSESKTGATWAFIAGAVQGLPVIIEVLAWTTPEAAKAAYNTAFSQAAVDSYNYHDLTGKEPWRETVEEYLTRLKNQPTNK